MLSRAVFSSIFLLCNPVFCSTLTKIRAHSIISFKTFFFFITLTILVVNRGISLYMCMCMQYSYICITQISVQITRLQSQGDRQKQSARKIRGKESAYNLPHTRSLSSSSTSSVLPQDSSFLCFLDTTRSCKPIKRADLQDSKLIFWPNELIRKFLG